MFVLRGTHAGIVIGDIHFVILSLALLLLLWEKRAVLVQTIRQSFTRTTIRWDVPEVMLLLSVIILAYLLRAFNLGNLYPAVDEYYQLIAAKQILQGAGPEFRIPAKSMDGHAAVTVALRIFGNELWVARSVGVLFNVLAIIPLYFLTRKINRAIAVLSSILYATSPWIITFAESCVSTPIILLLLLDHPGDGPVHRRNSCGLCFSCGIGKSFSDPAWY